MTADIRALSRQLSDIMLTGACKDIRDEGAYDGLRGGLVSALHAAISSASSLASLIVQYDEDGTGRCGCGERAIGRDMLSNPICAGCRALEAAALGELEAAEQQGAWDSASVRDAVLRSLPTQPDGSDR